MKRRKRGLDLTIDISEATIGPNPGPIAQLFRELRNVRGAFTLDDAGHFLLTLRMQTHQGLTGDLLEIGSYHGRSTAVMCQALAPGETIHVCDAFDNEGASEFAVKPTPEVLMRNIRRINPGFADDRIVIHNCLSQQLRLPAEQKFRFIHIDGGHDDATCYSDLQLAHAHVMEKGVIVVDDYQHPHYPGVTTATDRFLAETGGYTALLDVNRHGERGRKLYLGRL
jgi:predicted O-methyltransferase YrrM